MLKKIVKFSLMLFVSLSLASCDLLDSIIEVIKEEAGLETSESESSKVSEKESTSNSIYVNRSLKCYFDDELLGDFTISDNTYVNDPGNPLSESETYDFYGWDADGDLVAETFPYLITKDTVFKALYDYKTFEYSIYVRDTLISTTQAKYGTAIDYPNVIDEVIDGEVYFFLGWSYDGVYDGNTINYLTKSYKRIDACFATSQILKMVYNGGTYFSYVKENETITFLSNWKITPSAGKQIVWYTDSTYKTKLESDKMINGNLTIYGKEEYINPQDAGISINNKEEIIPYVEESLVNRDASIKFNLSFDVESINDLATYIIDNANSPFAYQISCSLKENELELGFTYNSFAIKSSTNICYSQVNSFNYTSFTNKRDESYDSFKVNLLTTKENINNSEALYYYLEKGYNPVINEENTNLINLYNNMKNVLRNICDDSMSDIEKALAIYEYLVMNTTYDYDLMQKVLTSTSGVEEYNSFYLEGVFNDHLAVCDGLAKAYASLCAIEGIRCVRVTGKTNNDVNHAWNKIMIDNKWYVVDVTSAGCVVDTSEYLTYSYFMLTDSKYSSYAISDNKYYSTINCTDTYNIYELLSIKIDDKDVSLNAKNTDEAAKLLKYYIDNASSGSSSFNFKLDYEFDSMKDELTNIINKLKSSVQLSYVDSLDSIIIIYKK